MKDEPKEKEMNHNIVEVTKHIYNHLIPKVSKILLKLDNLQLKNSLIDILHVSAVQFFFPFLSFLLPFRFIFFTFLSLSFP